MIDLTKTTISVYQQRVSTIYQKIDGLQWSELHRFEDCYRQISILNSKILSIRRAIKTSEIQKEE